MRTSTKVFLLIGLWGVVIAAIYWFVTYEPAGTMLLGVFGLMGLVIGAYTAREGSRVGGALEDQPDATTADAAGRPAGTFHFESAWPLWLSAGAALVGAGLVYGLYLVPVGAVAMVVAVLGLIRESRA